MGGHDVGGEVLVTGGVLAGDDDRLGHPLVVGQHRLDLTRFDTEATDLHLVVRPAHELQLTGAVPAHHVTGPVHARAAAFEQAGHEPLTGQPRTVQIPPGQPRAGDVQLTGHPRRHGVEEFVEHVHPRVVQRIPDRHDIPDRLGILDRDLGTDDGHLGRTVGVADRDRGHGLQHLPYRRGWDHVRAGEHLAQPGERGGVLLGDHPEQARGQLDVGQLVVADQRPEQRRVDPAPGGDDHLSAGQQRYPQLKGGAVEGVRRGEQAPGLSREVPAAVTGQFHHVPVGGRDALGLTRRSGGEHHVGQLVGQDPHRYGRVRRVGPRGRRLGRAGHDHRADVLPHGRRVHLVDQAHIHVGLEQHLPDALGRLAGIDGHIRATGLHHRQQSGHEVDRPVHDHADEGLRGHSTVHQMPGETIGPGLQFTVRDPLLARRQGNGLRGAAGVRGEQRRHRDVGRAAVAVPFRQQLPSLGGIQQVQAADGTGRVGGDGLQEADQPGDQRLSRDLVEQVGGVRESAEQAVGPPLFVKPLDDLEVEVELGHGGSARAGLDVQTRQVDRRLGNVLHRHGDLEQRVPGHRTGRGQLLHQPLERHLLVLQRTQRPLPHPSQQFGEARVTGQVGAHHQHVHEQSDQLLHRLVGPSGDRAADRDVLPRTQLGQQHRQGGLPHHEHRHALGTGQLRQIGVEFRRSVDHRPAAPVTGHRGAPPVHRKLQLRRRAPQLGPPISHLAGQHTVRILRIAQHPPLPQRVVRVTHRQRLPARRTPRAPRRVRHRQIPPQQPHRPPVARDVVHNQHQHRLTRHHRPGISRRRADGRGEQRGAQGELAHEVEDVASRLLDLRFQLVGGDRDHRQVHTGLGDGQDLLVRLPLHLRKAGPQTLVPRHHIAQRRPQRRHIQPPGQSQHQRNVVQRARALEPVHEPQPPLGIGERQHPRTRPGHHRRPRGHTTGLLQPRRQTGHSRRLEKGADGQFDSQHGADPAGQPHRLQRMSAQFEETVVDPDLRHAQHLGEDRAQKLLAHRGRSPSRSRAGSGFRGGQGGGGGFRLLFRRRHELQLTGAVPPHHVTGAVHPCTGFLKRAGHDLLGDRTRTVPLPAGRPGTRYIQLTGHPRRHRFEKGVQDVDTRVGRRIRDRYAPPIGYRRRGVVPLCIPLCQDPPPLRGIQQVDPADGPTGITDDRPQDPDQPGAEHVHRGLVEQIGGIGDAAAQTGRQTPCVETLDDLQVQVELGTLCPGRHDADLNPGQVQRHVRDVVQRQGDLEQRVPGHRTGRGQLLHQPLERHLLVLQRTQRPLPHPPQHLGESRVTRQVGAYHQRVHEEPGQLFQGLIVAPGYRTADEDVLPRAQPGQQHRHRGLPHHEHRHTLGTGQLRQLRMQFRGHLEGGQPTPVAGLRGPRSVHRQGQFLRRPGQRLPPVRQLADQHAVRIVRLTQQLPLPQRVVRVTHRQRLPARPAPRAPRRVRHRQIPPQQPHRPPVGRDVVHDQHQHRLTRHHQVILWRRLVESSANTVARTGGSAVRSKAWEDARSIRARSSSAAATGIRGRSTLASAAGTIS
ncbi:hypothetical protein SANTM175S_01702 [Streptomyces antimycoticus]